MTWELNRRKKVFFFDVLWMVTEAMFFFNTDEGVFR